MKKKPTSPLRHNENAELVPLTDKLYTEFSIELLEERLETDPLMLTGLFSEITPFCVQCKRGTFQCEDTYCLNCHGAGATYNNTCTCKATNLECYKN